MRRNRIWFFLIKLTVTCFLKDPSGSFCCCLYLFLPFLHNQWKYTVFPFPRVSWSTFMSSLCNSKYFRSGWIFKSFFFSKSEAALSIPSLFLNHFEILVWSMLKLLYFSITFFVDKPFSLTSYIWHHGKFFLLRFRLGVLSSIRIGFDYFGLSCVDCVQFFSIVNFFFSSSGSSCCLLLTIVILSECNRNYSFFLISPGSHLA